MSVGNKRPVHTKNDNFKDNNNDNYISVHTNTKYHSIYSKRALNLCHLLL